jgi:hypothetical protein
MNYKEYLVGRLSRYRKGDIIISFHAVEQAIFRGIDLEEVRQNILEPTRLSFAEKQKAKNDNEEKYNCYFGYSRTQCHRYAIVINSKCIVCTVIKINRRWQHVVEKHAKI